tara:strand:+ start:1353 stop:2228 length:876 start_codon:yes stop_codon:yes gene_type:complete
MNKELTIIIPSYRSKHLIIPLLNKYKYKYKFIIIENSFDKSFKQLIKKKYKNVEIYLKKNIGYGRAVNFASRKVKTKFFFVTNPDSKFYKNTINNLIKAAKKIKKFGALSPINLFEKKKFKKNVFITKKKIIAAAMLIKTDIFKSLKGYDENFFLYYEDNDFFLKCNSHNLKLYLITNSYFSHLKYSKKNKKLNLHSTKFKNFDEKKSTYAVGGWHGQWSKFYFNKKHKGFIKAFCLSFPSNFFNLIQMLIYIFINHSKIKYKYYKIEGFFCSLIGLPSFKRSIFDTKNFL